MRGVGIKNADPTVDPPAAPSDELPLVQCPSNSCDTTADMSDMESEVEYVDT